MYNGLKLFLSMYPDISCSEKVKSKTTLTYITLKEEASTRHT